jgi:hypothetical protein
MNTQKDFGQLDEADIQLVINNPNENPVWTGSCEELPPTELFTLAKKVLLIIPAEAECTAEKFNSILEAVRVRIPTDSLLLFTISDKKRLEIYVNKD